MLSTKRKALDTGLQRRVRARREASEEIEESSSDSAPSETGKNDDEEEGSSGDEEVDGDDDEVNSSKPSLSLQLIFNRNHLNPKRNHLTLRPHSLSAYWLKHKLSRPNPVKGTRKIQRRAMGMDGKIMKLPNVKLEKRTNETLPAAAKMHLPKSPARKPYPVVEKSYLSRNERFEIHDLSQRMARLICKRLKRITIS